MQQSAVLELRKQVTEISSDVPGLVARLALIKDAISGCG
jgi:hypothetical protein